ncbi:MAG: twin-arginine translocation signal domain-containing protein [Faecalibacterium sp.]|nr:twin-arginine translocation signal domain-containing protein [Faecalibacterium sp.]
MTTKMTRRTFLKGAAAAAAAVSLSGLLTGCGGDQELPDNAVQLGVFNVSIYDLNVDQGAELGGDAGAITGTVKIRFSDSGSSTQAVPYRGMFNATVGDSNLNQVAPTGTLVVSDALLGKPFATKEVTLKLSFPDEDTRKAYQSGKPAYLTITINGMTGVLYLVKRGNGYVATKTVG